MTRLLITLLIFFSTTAIGQDKDKYLCTIFAVSLGVRLPPQGCYIEVKKSEDEIKTDCFGGIAKTFKENNFRSPESSSVSKININNNFIAVVQSTDFNQIKTYLTFQLDVLLLSLRGSSDGPFGSSTFSGRCVK